jgi:hypothetical protein
MREVLVLAYICPSMPSELKYCNDEAALTFLYLLQNEADAYRKVRLRVEDVQGKNCLTNFWVSSNPLSNSGPEMGHYCMQSATRAIAWGRIILLISTLMASLLHLQGMDFTTDKLRSLVRKWQTLIEAHVDVKTTDGYLLRMFAIAFTKKRPGQVLVVSAFILPHTMWLGSCLFCCTR